MPGNVQKVLKNITQSPIVQATFAFALVAIGASWMVSGTPPRVEGDRMTFSGTDLEGRPVSLADQRFAGKVVVVDIWGTWCPPCLATIPFFTDFQRRFGPQGFEVIGVEFAEGYSGTREEHIEYLRGWVKGREINYTIVHGGTIGDVDTFFPDLKSFQSFPTTIIIGRDGRVRAIEAGYYIGMEKDLETLIGTLLLERLPSN
jgi:thiol-disulfide isomerase/thioredoxin